MPNWCYTSVKCTGNKEEIQVLHDRMKRLQEMKEPLKPNGFGPTLLGNLVEDLGWTSIRFNAAAHGIVWNWMRTY